MSGSKKYLLCNDFADLEFTCDSEEGALSKLHRFADAAPADVQTDLFELDEANQAWAWVSTVARFQAVDKVVRVVD